MRHRAVAPTPSATIAQTATALTYFIWVSILWLSLATPAILLLIDEDANTLLTDRQQLLDSFYEPDAEVQPPRSRTAARTDPRSRERPVRGARLRRGLDRGHRELRRGHARAPAPLPSAAAGSLHALLERLGALREERLRRRWAAARGRAWPTRFALARLDRGEPHDLARHDRPRRGHRRARREACRRRPRAPRAVALVAAHHADIAEDSPRLRHALECWTGLNRAATRRWLRGEATREATHGVARLDVGARPAHVRRSTGGE